MLRARFLLVGAVVASGVAGVGCADQSAAIRVGDQTVSEADFVDEVEALRDNETALQLIVGAARSDIVGELGDDSYSQPFVGYMVEQRVLLMLQQQLADQEGVELTDDELSVVRDDIVSQLQEGGVDPDELPDSYIDQLAEDLAVGQALQDEIPAEDLQAAFFEVVEETDVELNSRFGEWDADAFLAGLQGGQSQGAVTPPAGPQPAPGADDGADLGLPAG